ncbi:DinB family protein [Streptomyces sp. A7024]|uniref:DinB family protein n=1 Tax=Streptomyces coryli TaxID=1128680 RepID=A0A6G4U3G1_9ACTN|nr:DinB family protein [Streptomyces coryli]NGN66542.1 DinB family protein [Streptomyces coryli]
MVDIDEEGRPEPPLAEDEVPTLLGFLDYQRATLAWKCGGVDTAGLRATVGVSEMSLGGLLRHLARVEDIWFAQRLRGEKPDPRWAGNDWAAEWAPSELDEDPKALVALWQSAVDRSRELTEQALAEGGLSQPGAHTWPDGGTPSLRWIVCHMIEEYARHNGHADLIRETVDGLTGE